MFVRPDFYGSVTVGERGQIVLPASLRKKFKIDPGDKLLVLADQHEIGIMLVKAEVLNEVLSMMGEGIQDLSHRLKESRED
jgi:AbrB family looped-hinge helix DNA binding protein